MNEENKNLISFDSNDPKNYAQLNLLYEIGRILASLETMNKAAPQILEAMCRNLRFELGELWCLGKGETVLHFESVWHLPAASSLEKFVAASRRFKFPVGVGLPGKAWAKKAPVWIENLSGEDKMPRRFFAAETGLQSGFAFPILHGEKFLGVFSFFTREPRRVDDELLPMFAAVGNNIGQFIKRERTESHLRESEDRYRAFIEQSTEGIWRFELDEKFSVNLPVDEQVELAFRRGYLAECNDAMARMYGLERAEELVGSRIADLLDMTDAANTEYIRAFIESNYKLTDAESHEKDVNGLDKYFLNSLIGTVENDFLIRVWGTQRDITGQKFAERSLRESEENFRAFVQASSQAIWTTDTKGQNLEAFGWWENQTGQTRAQSAGTGFLEAIHPDDCERMREVWQIAIMTVEFFEIECRISNRQGGYQHFAIRGVPVFNTDDSFRQWIGTLTDITDRKLAEQSLKDNEERYRALVEATSTVVWRATTDGKLNFVGSFWETVSGQRVEETLGSGWLDALHPEDRPATINIWQQALATKNIYETEFRILTESGYRWFAVRGVPILNSDGSVREWVGANTDVHQRNLAEEKVRESEANFRQLAEAVPQFVWVTDIDGSFSFINEQWFEFSGLTLEQTNNPQMLAEVFHPGDFERLAKEWEKSLSGGQVLEIELQIRNRRGEYRWFLTRSRPVKDAGGNILKWFGTSTDITDGKQAESRLALVAEISEFTRAFDEPAEYLFAVAKAVGEHLQITRCLFNEIDLARDRETVHRDYCRGVESVAGIHRISDYSSVTSADMAAGKTVVNCDSKTDPRTADEYLKAYEPNGERSYIAVPLMRENCWVASLWVSDDQPREWSSQEVSLLETIAERTWTAIEKLRIDTALRESQEVLSLAMSSSRMGAWSRDLATEKVYWSAELEEIFGLRAGTFAGNINGFYDYVYAADKKRLMSVVQNALKERREYIVEFRFHHADGSLRWMEGRGQGIYSADGQPMKAYGIGIDITGRKQAEAERELLLESEQRAREVAEQANQAKDEFIALVSHELRSPLNAMLGWTRILQDQNPDEKTKQYALDVIIRNARSQSRLIEDLLDIARVGKGKLRLEMEQTELIPIINAAIEIIKPAAEDGNINLSQTLDRAADFITGDVDRLRQVIDNLLSNAVKFTPAGGSIRIKLERKDGNAKITISDTGLGISPEFLPQIFERFKQADPSATRRHGGLGIGLSLARDLVELHGGKISAQSAGEGKGSNFVVTLPLRM